MPELPEVETVRRGIESHIVGQTVSSVDVLRPEILKPPILDPEEFRSMLVGSRFINARRRGKHLIFGLDNGYALYAHLNMRGQLVVSSDSDEPQPKYLCITVRFITGIELRYIDIWRWGELRILQDRPEQILLAVPALATMGPEPLSGEFDWHILRSNAMHRPGSPIKSTLLDQSVVAGLGNIYADESLYRSGIVPLRKVKTLSDSEWHKLASQIKFVLSEAVDGGGTLSNNYVDVDGNVGRYKPSVYGRAKENCITCESPLLSSRVGGRSTVYCPVCQR